jgi:hypothetical protein
VKAIRVILAIAVTGLLLYVARAVSEGRPEHRGYSENGYTFEFMTVPKADEHAAAVIRIGVTGDLAGKTVRLRYTEPGCQDTLSIGTFRSMPLSFDTAAGEFVGTVTAGRKLQRQYYYFEITDQNGNVLATFKNASGKPFWLRAIGHVPVVIVGCHVLLMFATVFCIVMAAFHAFLLISGQGNAAAMGRYFLAAATMAFLGGYPFGFAMNHFAFGTLWEGIPFGTDATDNKTQMLFLYFVFITLVSLGSISRGKVGRDLFRQATLGWLGVVGFLLMLAVYLLPHSIQFAPATTYAVCYAYTAIVVLLYLVGYRRSRRSRPA